MARRRTRARRASAAASRPRLASLGGLALEVAGLALLGLSLLTALALVSYAPEDPVFRLAEVENAAGVVGASLAALLVGALGLGAAVPVVAMVVLGARLLVGRGLPVSGPRFWTGAALCVLALAAGPALLAPWVPAAGALPAGRLGEALAASERALFSGPGALLLSALLGAVGALGLLGVAPGRALVALGRGASAAFAAAAACGAAAATAGAALGRSALAAERALAAGAQGLARAAASAGGALLRAWTVWRERRARRARVAAIRAPEEPAAGGEERAGAAAPAPRAARGRAEPPAIVDHRERRRPAEPEQETFAFDEGAPAGPYAAPEIGLFQPAPPSARRLDREGLIMNSRILEKKLSDFGVNGRVVTVHPGPVITMYEYEPAPGVKVNRITNLSDDLALALRALSVRIIAPIPGKSVVGIEVPNAEREVVYIRDLLESRSYRQSGSKLTLALGKDIFGNPVEADLARMPHLLVAGATGTGKSVFLNSLLCSILFRAHPEEVKLLLIDPKLLELSIYEGIPHLIADVVTNPKRAAAALQGVVAKMGERYQRMAALGVRNIAQYNHRVEEERAKGAESFRLKPKPGETEGEEVPYQRLPYIVVVIDELADLMVVSARDVEESLQRLAQMARAAGIHLVLATQRPSVDVLTGIIKANFPARLSFQVSSRTDSRTILDQGGAEHLLGQGDLLFLPPGTSKLQRLHGSFVSEEEVGELVAHLRSQGAPRFDEELARLEAESQAREARPDDLDEHYDRALEIVAESRNASISYIQRRLKVGYNRAARMIEQMEIDGVVGPQEGTKPREVFIRPLGEGGVE